MRKEKQQAEKNAFNVVPRAQEVMGEQRKWPFDPERISTGFFPAGGNGRNSTNSVWITLEKKGLRNEFLRPVKVFELRSSSVIHVCVRHTCTHARTHAPTHAHRAADNTSSM